MTRIQLILFLLLQAVHSQCSFKAGDQLYYLIDISTETYDVTGPPSEKGEYTYKTTFCSDRVPCPEELGSGNLVRFKSDKCVAIYGKWENYENIEKTTNGFQIEFIDTRICPEDPDLGYYSCQFNFLCDTSAGYIGLLQANTVGDNSCQYTVDVHTNLTCEGSVPVNGNKSTGFSGGSLFLIALVTLIAVYCLGGMGVNFVKTKVIVLPQRSFWCSQLPSWTKTGCILSWVKTVIVCKTCYSLCCVKIFKAKSGDEKMADALIGEATESE